MRQHKVFWQLKEVKLQIINAWIEIKIRFFSPIQNFIKILESYLVPFHQLHQDKNPH